MTFVYIYLHIYIYLTELVHKKLKGYVLTAYWSSSECAQSLHWLWLLIMIIFLCFVWLFVGFFKEIQLCGGGGGGAFNDWQLRKLTGFSSNRKEKKKKKLLKVKRFVVIHKILSLITIQFTNSWPTSACMMTRLGKWEICIKKICSLK